MLIYHATTIENLIHILQYGLHSKHQTIWGCSRRQHLYFWAKPDMYETDYQRQELCLQRALENGQIAAATTQSQYTRLAVLVYDFNDENYDEYQDTSAGNMDGALEIPIEDIDLQKLHFYITAIDVYQPMLSPFYLTYLDLTPNISPLMRQVLQELRKTERYNLFELCMEPTYLQTLENLIPITSYQYLQQEVTVSLC